MTQESDSRPNYYVLVCGLPRPDSDVLLADGVTIRALGEPLTVFDLAAAGGSGFREWAVLEPIAPVCTTEIETAADATGETGFDTLNRAWLASALLCLRGYTRHLSVAFNSYSWSKIAGHQARSRQTFAQQATEEGIRAAVYESRAALPPFLGHTLDFHLKLLTNSAAKVDALDPADIEWIREHYSVVDRLAAESVPFRLALTAATDWRFAHSTRSAIARLWSGIESLFGVEAELTFRVAAYAASLLEGRGPARKARYLAVKKLYNMRSKAVHGAPLEPRQLQQAVDDSFSLLRAVLEYAADFGAVPTPAALDDALFQ